MDRTPPNRGSNTPISHSRSRFSAVALSFSVFLLGTSCASVHRSANESATEGPAALAVGVPLAPAPVSEIDQLRTEVTRLSAKVQTLEQQVGHGDETTASKKFAHGAKNLARLPLIPTQVVRSAPSDGGGMEPEASTIPGDREAALSRDEAVRSYRQAMILQRSHKYPEALLAFSAFLERHASHPLAGNAQYYIGEAYYQQGENKLAERELKRVEEVYPTSPMISFALARLAQIQTHLQENEEAKRHQSALDELFPASPAHSLLVRTNTKTLEVPDTSTPPPLPTTSSQPALDGPPASNESSADEEPEQAAPEVQKPADLDSLERDLESQP